MRNQRITFKSLALRLSLAVALGSGGALGLLAGEEGKAETAAPLPKAEEILANYTKAIGGREALDQHASVHTKGTFGMPAQGMTGAMETYATKPNKMLVKMTMPGLGEILSGYDGEVGWSLNPMTGPMVLDGGQLEQLQRDSDFYASLREADNYQTMETLALEEFEGRPCYAVKLVRHSGYETTEYFDQETGLLAGLKTQQETAMGKVDTTAVISDYKQFGGYHLPTKTVIKVMGMEQVLAIESVEFDAVDPGVFALPPEIKALVEGGGEAAAAPATAPATQAAE